MSTPSQFCWFAECTTSGDVEAFRSVSRECGLYTGLYSKVKFPAKSPETVFAQSSGSKVYALAKIGVCQRYQECWISESESHTQQMGQSIRSHTCCRRQGYSIEIGLVKSSGVYIMSPHVPDARHGAEGFSVCSAGFWSRFGSRYS